ncbi:hypothetical protein [Streptomyces sp. MB09-02B]|nr:hypothetical protein [Streptomyces sp. MB09-02B]MDX3642571.1 hypothetical protein [Streptomyces sp. MB09-02B]
MSVVLSLAGAPPSRVAVGASPLAELTAAPARRTAVELLDTVPSHRP